MDEKILIANRLVPDNEVWVSQTTFDNPFSKNVDVVLKPSHNNARDKIFRPCGCVVCKHNAMHECQLPECKFSKRKTSPVE